MKLYFTLTIVVLAGIFPPTYNFAKSCQIWNIVCTRNRDKTEQNTNKLQTNNYESEHRFNTKEEENKLNNMKVILPLTEVSADTGVLRLWTPSRLVHKEADVQYRC